jgi:hypothetical protein
MRWEQNYFSKIVLAFAACQQAANQLHTLGRNDAFRPRFAVEVMDRERSANVIFADD